MKRILFAILATAIVPACSGDGNHGFDNNPPVAAPKLTINAANGEMATKTSYVSAAASVGIGDILDDSGLIAEAPAGFSKAVGEQASKVIDVTIHGIPFGPQVTPCLVTGSITISGDIANPTTLTAGDTFRIEADQCDDGLEQVVDGLLDLAVVSFDGDIFSGIYQLQMSMEMTDFQVVTPTDTLTSNGDAAVSLDTTQAPRVTSLVSGNTMTVDSNSSAETLSAYGSAETVDAGMAPAPYTWSAYGTLDSTQLDGVVDYTTPVTFEGEDSDYPHAGELLVEGDRSSARLIVLDSVRVRIEFDYDADGSVDEILETTWVDLAE